MELVHPYTKNHTQILQLFHPFIESVKAYAVESYSKVFLCGDTTAGKSSLCELIKYRKDKSSDHEYDPAYRVNVTPLTAGIEVHTITSLEIGHIVMYLFRWASRVLQQSQCCIRKFNATISSCICGSQQIN